MAILRPPASAQLRPAPTLLEPPYPSLYDEIEPSKPVRPRSAAGPDVEMSPQSLCGEQPQHGKRGRRVSPPKGPKLRPAPFPVSDNLLPVFSMLPDAMEGKEVLVGFSDGDLLLTSLPGAVPIELRGASACSTGTSTPRSDEHVDLALPWLLSQQQQ
mmetsp:Transcript_84435/g.162921  ORF Transcript_84435/g.162921 Transcript_84435/m.162921 type:complete len:157 (+) Transcript_84435:76-546(+)